MLYDFMLEEIFAAKIARASIYRRAALKRMHAHSKKSSHLSLGLNIENLSLEANDSLYRLQPGPEQLINVNLDREEYNRSTVDFITIKAEPIITFSRSYISERRELR